MMTEFFRRLIGANEGLFLENIGVIKLYEELRPPFKFKNSNFLHSPDLLIIETYGIINYKLTITLNSTHLDMSSA